MIVKELDPFQANGKYQKAGRAAEEKMAFYLRVNFDDDKDVHVLNSIRLELDDGAVQIDHLILHPWGMIIVESKSVTGKVQIKEDGQWIRWFNDKSSGMESPVTQGNIQARRLKRKLNSAAKPAGFFDQVPMDVFVAISDQGVILYPKGAPVDGVWKADQIAEKISSKLAASKSQEPVLPKKDIETIANFLLAMHRPIQKERDAGDAEAQAEPLTLKIAEPEPAIPYVAGDVPKCKHCNGSKLEGLWGKYGYYFRCLECGKNTAMQSSCQACGQAEKIHKRGADFSAECESCQTSHHYFSNGAPVSGNVG